MTAGAKSIRTISILILLTALFATTSDCSMAPLQNLEVAPEGTPQPDTSVEKVLCSTEEVILAWDPPHSNVIGYKIFYRGHESGSWILLGEIPADDDPEYSLYHCDFGDGDYVFGIVAVAAETAESAMHTSLDETAQPESGWYLSWEL